MTDNAPAGATPVVADATSTQSSPASAAGSQPATGATDPDAEALGDPGKRALDAMKSERTAALARAKVAEAELDRLKTAALSEEDKRAKHVSELEQAQTDWQRERKELRLEREVDRAARKLGFIDPADALGRLDRTSVEYESDGSPKNLEQQLTALAKAAPHLLTPPKTGGSFDTGRSGSPAVGQQFTREQLQDPKFYAENAAAILKAHRERHVTG